MPQITLSKGKIDELSRFMREHTSANGFWLKTTVPMWERPLEAKKPATSTVYLLLQGNGPKQVG